MKKTRSISFSQLGVMIALLLIFACSTLFLFGYRRDERLFHSLTTAMFLDEMSADTLNMHYTLADPSKYGIKNYTPTLSCYREKESAKEESDTEMLLQKLSEINPDKLKKNDADTYFLLKKFLENKNRLDSFAYYPEPFSPSSGVQSQFPVLLAEYSFRTKRDVEDYLAILGQTDEYFRSLLLYETEKKEAGLFMAASSAEKVISQCGNIINEKTLESNRHFLQTTFAERLAVLLQNGTISKEESQKYIEQNEQMLRNTVLPAYQELGRELSLLKDDSIAVKGMASKPAGRDYYLALLAYTTGSERDISEIRNLLFSALQNEITALRDLSETYPEVSQKFQSGFMPEFPLTDEAAILADLQKRMETDFPTTSDTNVMVKEVSKSLEKYTAPAFFLTPPIDDYDSNVIYINSGSVSDRLDLYTTLAHEGYPGHLYQSVYSNSYFHENGDEIVHSMLWYGGYLEGWALYSEFAAYDYASALFEERDQADSAVMVQFEKHNRSLQLCLYCILDIMIHYENAPALQVAESLAQFGITSPSAANALYSYIAEEPCNYLKYYLGYLELLDLKNKTKEAWGTAYSDYRFHKFYLENGPADFSSLAQRISSE